VEDQPFRLTVWAADGPGGTPGTVISQNLVSSSPDYNGQDVFQRLELENPVLVSGGFYVGWTQLTDVLLNIGFDLNNDFSNRIYFNIDNISWNQASFDGALLMRPAFKTEKDFLLSAPEAIAAELPLRMYPNPTTGSVTVEWATKAQLQVIDLGGRVLLETSFTDRTGLDFSGWDSGIYLIRLFDGEGRTRTERIVLQSNR